MKQFRFSAAVIVALVVMFSCNSGDEKKVEDAPDTTAVNTPQHTAPAGPVNILTVMHKVANFDKWLPAYEGHDSARRANGLRNYIVGRGLKDSNMVFIAMFVDDTARAKAFGASPDLKNAMKKAGVVGMPTSEMLSTTMLDTTTTSAPRVRINFKVKDWDIWKKSFDDNKQMRMDAGLIDRAVGHRINDNHMVSLVCVATDMKKAEDFGKSPGLKERMEKGGVEGPPTIFYYNVVKRY
ncbi:MAG TPA: hypothetical protein VK489_16565 [Ferruginibacter sp.]|nr:hypothetical protein [Ferruginibacter sp.]